MADQWGLDLDIPWKKLPKSQKDAILYGANGREVVVNWNSDKIKGEFKTSYEGLLNIMMRRYKQTQSEHQKNIIQDLWPQNPARGAEGGD